jgi:hypothetical protein
MRQRVVSTDRFYDDPYSIRKAALTAEYQNSVSVRSFSNDEAMAKFSSIAQSKLELLEDSGKFYQSLASTAIKPISALPFVDWVGVVYLTLPTQAEGHRALSLYSHNKTGLESFPDDVEAHLGGWTNLEEVLEGFVEIDGLQNSCWTDWFTIYQRYNRAVLFDAKLWHRELQGFGDTINNCRLSQLFYLRNK